MKIGVNFFLMIGMLNLAGTLLPLEIVLHLNHKRNNELIHNEIINLSAKQGLISTKWFSNYLLKAPILGQYEAIPPAEWRDLFSMMVKSIGESELDIIGAVMLWPRTATGPFLYPIDGEDRMMATVAMPITYQAALPQWLT
jgi:hypothetical protein